MITEKDLAKVGIKKPEPKPAKTEVVIKEVKADTSKIEAVSRLAYDKADAAMKVANNFTSLIGSLTDAVKDLKPKTNYKMNVVRDKRGFISSIDIEVK